MCEKEKKYRWAQGECCWVFTLDAVSQVESGQSSQAQENKGTLEFWDGRGFPVTDHTHKPSVPSSKFHDAKICNILSPYHKKKKIIKYQQKINRSL